MGVAVLLAEDARVLAVRVKKGSRDPKYDVVKRAMLSASVPEEDMTFDETIPADSTQPPLELPSNEHWMSFQESLEDSSSWYPEAPSIKIAKTELELRTILVREQVRNTPVVVGPGAMVVTSPGIVD